MIRYKVSKGMKILFVGINPSPSTYQRGVPFSNNKTFWYLLNRAGLINEENPDLKDDIRLKQIYDFKFNSIYRYGLLNVINRPTKDVSRFKKGEERKRRQKILDTVQILKPPVVCFIGKIAYEKFSGLKKFKFGLQDDIFGSKSFVMHFPLHGKSSIRIRELRLVMRLSQK